MNGELHGAIFSQVEISTPKLQNNFPSKMTEGWKNYALIITKTTWYLSKSLASLDISLVAFLAADNFSNSACSSSCNLKQIIRKLS